MEVNDVEKDWEGKQEVPIDWKVWRELLEGLCFHGA